MDWSPYFPVEPNKLIEYVDVGCGYGGLLIAISKLYPDVRAIGMEIRVKVSQYVNERIKALRNVHPQQYDNIGIIRANSMKYISNFFDKGQLSKMFFLFPDPHFKKKKQKARIITPTLLSEYAYLLKIGGIIYTATDVKDLHEWMKKHLESHPLFEKIQESEWHNDPIVYHIINSTEEGIKVTRNNGK